MIRKLYVDNFKSLNNFEIALNPATFIIGANASGKSTVLNAIAFLKYCCIESANAYLEKHQLTVSDICSKFSKKRTISFAVVFDFNDKEVLWNIEFTANKTGNSLVLSSEKVSKAPYGGANASGLQGARGKETLLYYSSDRIMGNGAVNDSSGHSLARNTKSYRFNELARVREEIIRGEYNHSHLSIISKDSCREYPELYAIKEFFDATESFDVLSPKDMRASAHGYTNSIGRYGEKLATFIKGLDHEERRELVNTMKTIFPDIKDIKSVVRGRPGWAYLEVDENYSSQNVSISSRNVSDGIIRLIALFSMKYHKNNGGVMLLDEIENGINCEIMERLLISFQENGLRNGQQFIATTHNTVLLDYVDPDNIRYLLRDKQGNAIAYNPFSHSLLKEKLDYMYPGEIILNTPNEELDAFVAYNKEDNL